MPKRKYTLKGFYSYIPFLQTYLDKQIAKYDTLSDDTIRSRLYRNLYQGYDSNTPIQSINRIHDAVLKNKKESHVEDGFRQSYMDDLWATYLNIPQNKRRGITGYGKNYVENSNYTPTKGNKKINYKRLNHYSRFGDSKNGLDDREKRELVSTAITGDLDIRPYVDIKLHELLGDKKVLPLKIGENKLSKIIPGLGTHTVGRGLDPKNGEYVSYYDLWDMSPDTKGGEDKSLGIGTPIHFYDRIYLDDYFDIPTKYRYSLEDKQNDIYYGGYLPEVTIKPKRK